MFSKRFTLHASRSTTKGFTLIEMIVAAFIFSVIMRVAVGATLSIVAANQQAEAVKAVVSNFNYALESMVRNIRIGTGYQCVGTSAPFNCTAWTGNPSGGSSMTFTDYNGVASGYKLSGTIIQKYIPNSYLDITSSDVKVDSLVFYVDGNGRDNRQPSVLIVVKGHVDVGNRKTSFAVETLATQRRVDVGETVN